VSDGFDFSPGAQVPLMGAAGQTAATQALASAAYRDSDLTEILKADNEWHKSTIKGGSRTKEGRTNIFAPNLGEAFSRAVQTRTLGGGRKALIQSFGIEAQTVVEHCLAANHIRKERDRRLTLVTVVFGVLFLPGLLLWLGVFALRRGLSKGAAKSAGAIGTLLLVAVGVLAVIVLLFLPFNGVLGWYLRGMILMPVVGWYLAKRISESTAKDLRGRWQALLGGGGIGAKVPDAVPGHPGESSREELRQGLQKLTAEQQSNVVFYAGPKGILGMGTRWGGWQLAEQLVPKEAGTEIHGFRSWDVIKAIHDQLKLLERGPLNTGGFPTPSVKHWIVAPVAQGAGAVSRPEGQDIEAYQVKPHEIQRICNEQQFSSGNRHYLGVQFTLWDGQLVLTMMISVTVLHETLRIEVTGHALGPVHGLFTTPPSPKTVTSPKMVKFWETNTHTLPLVNNDEIVRLAVRAPLLWYPPILDHLGGKLELPEPFGLRHAWAEQPWLHRFMADDALRMATPVLRATHNAALKFLAEHGVDTTGFGNRAGVLSGAVQDPSPSKADTYNA
jgi:hypothetical protein